MLKQSRVTHAAVLPQAINFSQHSKVGSRKSSSIFLFIFMAYKIPIDANIIFHPDLDMLDHTIWLNILLRCQREKTVKQFKGGNKIYEIALEQGQAVISVAKFAEELRINRKTVIKKVEKISVNYEKVELQRKPYGLLISVKNYLSIIKMDKQGNYKGTTEELQGSTIRNQSVESVESGGDARARKAPPEDSKEKQTDVPTTPDLTAQPHIVLSNALKEHMGIDEWVDRQHEEKYSKELRRIFDKIGNEEFTRRIDELLDDKYHSTRMNEIKYVYFQMAGYKSKIN